MNTKKLPDIKDLLPELPRKKESVPLFMIDQMYLEKLPYINCRCYPIKDS
jgi:hypothetical protein